MRFLTKLIQQLRTYWSQTSNLARGGIIATALLSVAAIVGVGFWSSRPQYVPIASDLDPTTAAEIVSKLDAQRIPNRLNFSGSAVLVPQSQWSDARLAVGDLAGPNPPPADALPSTVFDDPAQNHYRMLRNKESLLARSIGRMAGVEHATVHISQPEPSPFVRDTQPTTASVVLEPRRGVSLTREQAATIVAMVASSVEGLQPDKVTVVDTTGRQLSADATGADAGMAGQYEYQRKLEADLAARAELMLAQMLGHGRAVVRVTADVDFTRTSRESITYDPELKVKKTERTKSVSRNSPRSESVVGAGTPANLSASASNPLQGKPLTEKEEENETEYETPQTIDKIDEAMGTIKRLTVAVVVDLSAQAATGQNAQAPAAVTKEQIESIVKQAVGFDDQRNDKIEVLPAKLVGVPAEDPTEVAGAPFWERYSQLIRNASLGLGSLVALVLGLLILRRLRPVPAPATPVAAPQAERARQIAGLATQASANPEVVARIIRAWLKQSAGGEPEAVPFAPPGQAASSPSSLRPAAAKRAA